MSILVILGAVALIAAIIGLVIISNLAADRRREAQLKRQLERFDQEAVVARRVLERLEQQFPRAATRSRVNSSAQRVGASNSTNSRNTHNDDDDRRRHQADDSTLGVGLYGIHGHSSSYHDSSSNHGSVGGGDYSTGGGFGGGDYSSSSSSSDGSSSSDSGSSGCGGGGD